MSQLKIPGMLLLEATTAQAEVAQSGMMFSDVGFPGSGCWGRWFRPRSCCFLLL